MKSAPIPADPTNTDLAIGIAAAHECVHANGVRQARDHRAVLKLIAASEKRLAALEKRVDDHRIETQQTFKTNSESFALWLASDTSSKEQTTALINQLATMITALGADKPKHRSLFAMSQGSAMWRIVAVVATVVIAMPLASKIVAAIWGAVSTVLLK